ncbi:hypothetical protein E1292_27440 [Nonomuraea deserti]|uniref:PQQ-like beta-propeller repeat protein n=1 Tax=Nonomuraea deserti TaxID=1848322 RepID=A0A4R4V817_9ACTN|nr:hypothetical protein [Nonomuraea deserti]TDD00851.1 hypothetical protein E1292_27440 [Nonomuraea deserti]
MPAASAVVPTASGPGPSPVASPSSAPPVGGVWALVCCEGRLFAACADGTLAYRDVSGQNLPWRTIDDTDAIALAAPREAHGGPPAGLFGVAVDGTIRYRDPVPGPAPWQDVGQAPEGTTGLAAADERLFAITAANELWHLPIRHLNAHNWTMIGAAAGPSPCPGGGPATGPATGPAGGPVTGPAISPAIGLATDPAGGPAGGSVISPATLAAMNGRLFTVAADRILTRSVNRYETPWADLGPAAGNTVLAAASGRLIGTGPDGTLRWRPIA